MEVKDLLEKYNHYIQTLSGELQLSAVDFIVANPDCNLDTIKHHVELQDAAN